MGGGDVVGTAIVNLKSDTSGFISDLTSALSKGQGLFSNFGSDISGSLKGAGGIMTAGITAPIVAMGALSVESFEKINNSETSLIRQTNSTGAAADQMRTSFTNVFSNTPSSAEDVVTAMTEVHNRLGITGTALEQVTTQGLNMSRMLGTDVSSSVDGVAKAMQAFNAPASSANAVMDQLYTVATKTGVPLTDMTTALTKLAPVATASGLSMTQMQAAVGAMASSGIPARQSVTVLQTAIQDFTAAGIPASKALSDIASGNMNAAEQSALFGKGTAANRTELDKLVGGLTNSRNGYNSLTTDINNSNGAIAKQAEATMTLGEKLTEFKNKAEVALAPLGKVLVTVMENALDAVAPLLDILTKVLGVFSNMPAPIQLIVVAIAGIAAAIGPVMMIVGMLLPAFGAISTLLAGPMVAAAIAFALPFLPIIIAVAAIGIGLYLLYTYFKPFHDAVNQVVGWVKTLVGDLMSGNFSKLGTDFKNGIMAGIAALMKIDWGSVATQFLSALLLIPPQLLKALQSLDWGGLAHSIITFLTTDVPKFLDAMKNLDWGGFAMLVLQALCGLDIMFINALINLDWGGILKA